MKQALSKQIVEMAHGNQSRCHGHVIFTAHGSPHQASIRTAGASPISFWLPPKATSSPCNDRRKSRYFAEAEIGRAWMIEAAISAPIDAPGLCFCQPSIDALFAATLSSRAVKCGVRAASSLIFRRLNAQPHHFGVGLRSAAEMVSQEITHRVRAIRQLLHIYFTLRYERDADF